MICAAALIVLSACATVVPLTGHSCRPWKSWGLVHQDGENGIRDDVAAYGGNAYISRQGDADWFWGHVNYTAEAYRCPLDPRREGPGSHSQATHENAG